MSSASARRMRNRSNRSRRHDGTCEGQHLTLIVLVVALLLLISLACSPRDFLTRRLAGGLIAGSAAFRHPQPFQLRTGVVSNKDYLSPDYLVLLHRGWISATSALLSAELSPRRLAGISRSLPPAWTLFTL